MGLEPGGSSYKSLVHWGSVQASLYSDAFAIHYSLHVLETSID